MMKKNTLSFLILVLLSDFAIAQKAARMTASQYQEAFKDAAISDMKKTGVPASITLSQGMYESDFGNSDLATEANNHFGIKCHKEWSGNTFHKDDDAKDECFRKYNTVQQSYDDHSYFLRSRPRYAFLFDLEITDYKGWARGLKKAGYATNPAYAQKIIELIERYELFKLDRGENLPVASIAPVQTPVKNAVKQGQTMPKIKTAPFAKQGSINNVPYVRAGKNDSYVTIARDNNIMLWQVLKYNDADKSDALLESEIVYLKPKRAKTDAEFHIVKAGENIRDIAQLHGIKSKKIYSRNNLEPGAEPKRGDKLWLNKCKPN